MIKSGHNRSGGNSGGSGNFFIRKSLDLAQGKRRAQFRREGIENLPEAGNAFISLGLLAGIVGRGRLRSRLDCVVVYRKRKKPMIPPLTLSQVIDGAPYRDRMNPRREFGVASKLRQPFPDCQPHFLANVARVMFVAHDGVDEPEDVRIMLPHEDTECRFVARLGAAQDPGIGRN